MHFPFHPKQVSYNEYSRRSAGSTVPKTEREREREIQMIMLLCQPLDCPKQVPISNTAPHFRLSRLMYTFIRVVSGWNLCRDSGNPDRFSVDFFIPVGECRNSDSVRPQHRMWDTAASQNTLQTKYLNWLLIYCYGCPYDRHWGRQLKRKQVS
jgi:hypothetical protein